MSREVAKAAKSATNAIAVHKVFNSKLDACYIREK